ncbi:MAG: methyltransferase domain-containing protein [Dehalococcoidia bacterium]|nr:methyltransferase domain-containing protein [Dehalococcoidia bacterium]
MTEHPTFGDFILGFEGLAILRSWGLDPGTVQERARSIAEVVESRGEPPWATPLVEIEYEVQTGYGEWARGYDRPDNPVLLAEEPVVREMLGTVPIGTALDAACGTGRWAQHLASLGHDVTGFDATPEMLEAARTKVPAAHFELADLTAIPLPPEAFDLVVCTLALTHLTRLRPPIGELARVVRPGGRVIISDVHPLMAMLGSHARYPRGQEEFGFVQNHVHQVSDYLSAFRDAGLSVTDCREPVWTGDAIAALGFGDQRPGLLEAAVEGLPIVIVWELEKA